MTITFFGHRDTPAYVQTVLENTIKRLLASYPHLHFLIGNQGAFDNMALRTVADLAKCYPQITYDVVLAYLPQGTATIPHSIYPEELEEVPKRFAISKRNNWLIAKSDGAIAYVIRSYGGAAQTKRMAERKGMPIYNLADIVD